MMHLTNRQSRGFTLIELLIVVAIIGILAAIAVPNLLAAMQRAKQKRTMANMRNIANALEARFLVSDTYAPAGATSVTFPTDSPITLTEISSMLSPTYLREVPTTDGWGKDLEFNGTNSDYYMRSAGSDLTFSGTTYADTQTNFFQCDIVYSNGTFVVYPEGVQALGK